MKVLKWVLIVFGILIVLAAAVYSGAWYENKHPKSITQFMRGEKDDAPGASTVATTTTTTAESDEAACTAGASACKTPGAYDTWQTYTNQDVGYTLKYPQKWILKETNEVSEVTETEVKYVTITSEDQQSYLHLGVKKKTDSRDFVTSDRTGIGAGDDVAVTAKKFLFLGDYIVPYRHVWEGKNQEFFFKKENIGSTKFTGDFTVNLGPAGAAASSTSLNMADSLLDIPILILESVAWL